MTLPAAPRRSSATSGCSRPRWGRSWPRSGAGRGSRRRQPRHRPPGAARRHHDSHRRDRADGRADAGLGPRPVLRCRVDAPIRPAPPAALLLAAGQADRRGPRRRTRAVGAIDGGGCRLLAERAGRRAERHRVRAQPKNIRYMIRPGANAEQPGDDQAAEVQPAHRRPVAGDVAGANGRQRAVDRRGRSAARTGGGGPAGTGRRPRSTSLNDRMKSAASAVIAIRRQVDLAEPAVARRALAAEEQQPGAEHERRHDRDDVQLDGQRRGRGAAPASMADETAAGPSRRTSGRASERPDAARRRSAGQLEDGGAVARGRC